MDFYYYPVSLYSQKALMAIYEQNLNVNLHQVSLADPEQRAAYAEIYPLGKVPALRTEQELIPESTSIVDYFDSLQPTKPLIHTQQERRVRHWDRMLDMYLLEPAILLFFQSMKAAPDIERVKKAKFHLVTLYKMVEQQLEGREFLVEDSLTLADITLMCGLQMAERAVPYADYKNLVAFYARHKERESYQTVQALAKPALEELVKLLSAAA